MIERGLRHGSGDCITSGHLRQKVKSGDMMLWAVHDGAEVIAAIVLAVHQYPAKMTLAVELAAGSDMDLWVGRIEELLSEYRDLIGADTIEATCRAGMAKRLADRGWKRKSVVMEMR